MGKWTQLHVENVLVEKMRTIVQSVMQDIKDNDTEPSMSFDAFAEHLDINNGFVKQLVELMVMETADTRVCSRDPESAHVSQRTFNKLQSLSSQYHTNDRRPRRFSTRRSEIMPPINTDRMPPDLIAGGWTDVADELDQDEEMLDLSMGNFPLATGSVAGRYDVMIPDGVDPETGIARLRHAPTPPWNDLPASARTNAAPEPASPPYDARQLLRLRGDTANASSLTGAALARQQSLRRPPRQRTVDFNDWTDRVRATARRGQDTRPRGPSGGGMEGDSASAPVIPLIPSYHIGSLPYPYHDGPSDSEEIEAYRSPPPSRTLRQSSASHDLLTSASSVRRHIVSNRLRRGGIPPPENILSNPPAQNNNHLTVGSGVTAPRSILDGSSATFHRSPSPLISLFEGTERTIPLQRGASQSRSPAAARTEPTHLATPRSSTPGSVEAVEGESTNGSGPIGAAELA